MMLEVIGKMGPAKHTQGGAVSKGFYSDGSAALVIYSDQGRECTATVCLAPEGPTPKNGFVWLKGWGGNEGVPEALEAAGILKRTGEKHPTGFCEAELAELTINQPTRK
jgi:hypothetical protein